MTDEAAFPQTGAVESAPKQEAADLVADLADEKPAERMLIALDIDGTVLLEDDSLSRASPRRRCARSTPVTR